MDKKPINTKLSRGKEKVTLKFNPTIVYFLIVVYSFLIYSNTLKFKYAGDDTILIQQNKVIEKGLSNVADILTKGTFYGYNGQNHGAYRPISMLTFAAEIQLWGKRPEIAHFINVLLYVISGILIYKILLHFFQANILIALLATTVFLSHPIHSEVVSNIKSRDEILAFLLGFLIPAYIFLKNDSYKPYHLAIIYCSFFLGLFAKENSIVLSAVILLTLYFFKNIGVRKIAYHSLPFFALTGIYLLIRSFVLESPPEDPSLTNSLTHVRNLNEKIGTVSVMMLEYVKKLTYPINLSWDYSFKETPIYPVSNLQSILSLLFHFLLVIYALLTFKNRNIISYFIIFYFLTIAIYSNIFIPLAQNIADRFLFIPSFAFCGILVIVLNTLANRITKSNIHFYLTIPLLLVITFYSIKTIARNTIWKNNLTIFQSGVKDAPNSFHTHQTLGLFFSAEADKAEDPEKKKNLYSQALESFEKSLSIYPAIQDNWYMLGRCAQLINNNKLAEFAYLHSITQFQRPKLESLFNLASLYNNTGNYSKAIQYYIKVDSLKENFNDVSCSLGKTYLSNGDLVNAKIYLDKAFKANNKNKEAISSLGVLYFKSNDYEKASYYFYQSTLIDECYFEGLKNLAVIYQMQNKYQDAIKFFEKTINCNYHDENIYLSLINIYRHIGMIDKAKAYESKLNLIKKGSN